ncbi:GGDEF domain-containing protein [Fervidobacterium islandicum]|uniref:GGDEF domain-containing protein n=1 Tax=Fervidobacterium islandicum TaxID=2423 RepID=A0AAI8CL74_FERIS|nr:GGDEF domain-containing protein [Fervidobacterium islandicum]AMW32981.1 GGDEF domain-containing protein [Fervidobacterium islandicum]
MEKFEELISLRTSSQIPNLTMLVVDFITELDELEFVDKLAKAVYVHTNANGVRVMTPNFVKILGTNSGVPLHFDSEHVKIIVYFSKISKEDIELLNSASIICELHYRNILKHSTISNMALYDYLTGAYTRTAGMKILGSAVESVQRTGRTAFVVFIDIDDLKTINDAFGHSKGDETLKEFAQACLNNMRKTDFLVRYGGDEFVLFVDSENPNGLLERIRSSCGVEFSYGLARIEQGQTLVEILKLADKRMYEEKKKKRV